MTSTIYLLKHILAWISALAYILYLFKHIGVDLSADIDPPVLVCRHKLNNWDSLQISSLCHEKSLKISKGNHNPYIEEGQTTQWPNEKVQKDKQRSTYKTKDRATRTPLKSGGERRCSGRVSISCSTSDTRRISFSHGIVCSFSNYDF